MKVRTFVELSTGHLPNEWLPEGTSPLDKLPGVVADQHHSGWWLWVPDDPDGSAAAVPLPALVLRFHHYARALGCDWVRFESDCDPEPRTGLPIFDPSTTQGAPQ